MTESLQDRLSRAREGRDDAWNEIVGEFRPWLLVLAQRQLGAALRRRVDPLDVVQETCLDAHRSLGSFRGTTRAELSAWLRRVLENNVAQLVERHVLAQRRSVRNERRLEAEGSRTARPADRFPGPVTSPSQRAMRGEGAIVLARALGELPEDQRDAVRLRHIEGWTLADIALWFDRSEVAVAALLKRGLLRLRRHLPAPPEASGSEASPR